MAGAVLGKGVETALKRGRLGDGKWERRRGSWDRKNEGKRRWGTFCRNLFAVAHGRRG